MLKKDLIGKRFGQWTVTAYWAAADGLALAIVARAAMSVDGLCEQANPNHVAVGNGSIAPESVLGA